MYVFYSTLLSIFQNCIGGLLKMDRMIAEMSDRHTEQAEIV